MSSNSIKLFSILKITNDFEYKVLKNNMQSNFNESILITYLNKISFQNFKLPQDKIYSLIYFFNAVYENYKDDELSNEKYTDFVNLILNQIHFLIQTFFSRNINKLDLKIIIDLETILEKSPKVFDYLVSKVSSDDFKHAPEFITFLLRNCQSDHLDLIYMAIYLGAHANGFKRTPVDLNFPDKKQLSFIDDNIKYLEKRFNYLTSS